MENIEKKMIKSAFFNRAGHHSRKPSKNKRKKKK